MVFTARTAGYGAATIAALALFTARARAQTLITFDTIPGGLIGTQYLAQGVMFYKGNGVQGASTGLATSGGNPITASVGAFGTAVSGSNVMVPAGGSNNDIYVYFFSSPGHRIDASFVGVTNDSQGSPPAILQAFDKNGNLLGATLPLAASQPGSLSFGHIYSVRIIGQPGKPDLLGIDNFRCSLNATSAPEPGALALLALGIGPVALLRRRRPNR